MENQDKVISLEDWIDLFWQFQEEDIKYFQNLVSTQKSFEPEEILKNIKERVNMRKVFYQFYKHLSKKDFSSDPSGEIEQKLSALFYREEMITRMINKVLELLSIMVGVEEQKILFEVPINPPVFH
ncbi:MULTISPECIES: hypothetical protein [Thermodesulfobacterium]|jgi:predicted unusual protein kinase regulating ubiquinone biosynthesis (AarF/ABC1/UbiB family)|uniref:Uncharacterized protein n=2 Tax=Thermodesulfobacterium commune TaxID=1741 RepID=A0A075WWA9_9BACT|nr:MULTISPECIES: hypothetical protein [Thermodesulfobacterium]KUJ98255.1 MAG: Uncharacterized protein XD42_0082 [Thermodesulfobacterium sp. 37_54]KUK19725.1 MAG: Uncharacterized protein XD55_0218 [Thermodesulfobacterium commune]AIH04788.1 hypothetical protein HL41_09140 [Thermodesulfobacterium commune DSM 2178]KUK38024.1 MAG: Uncharacterized protein XD67_0688 [Thermodesulfobacterium commune]MBZ4682002.1 hypothetical protein [Thermodesulfobacterium sp.]